jgi:hypothetical protein
MTLTNKTTESSIIEILSVPEDLQPKVLETLKSEALRPDVQLISQRLARKKSEEITDLSESQAAERVAIAVLSLFPDADAAKPCLKGLRKFFADGLKLMPPEVTRVIGSARLKAFNTLPSGDKDVICAMPYSVAYEVTKLEPEDQKELVQRHFDKQRDHGAKPTVISRREVINFRAERTSCTGATAVAQPSDEAKQASTNSLTDEQLKEAAPDIKGAVFAEMLRLKIEKAFKQDPTPQLANQIQGFAEMLVSIASEIEDRLQDFG